MNKCFAYAVWGRGEWNWTPSSDLDQPSVRRQGFAVICKTCLSFFYVFCDDLINQPEDKYLIPIQRRKKAHAGTARPAGSCRHLSLSKLYFLFLGSHRTMNPSLVTTASRTRIAEFNGTAIPLDLYLSLSYQNMWKVPHTCRIQWAPRNDKQERCTVRP